MTYGVFMRDSDMIDELVMSRLRKRADSLTQREVAQSATELRSHAFSILAGLQPISKSRIDRAAAGRRPVAASILAGLLLSFKIQIDRAAAGRRTGGPYSGPAGGPRIQKLQIFGETEKIEKTGKT